MIRNLIVLLFYLLLGGCAFTEMHLELPTTGLEEPIRGGDDRTIIVLKPFLDNREDISRCGMKKNGYNMDTADATCNISPGDWLSQLLVDELRSSGFNTDTPASDINSNTIIIEGSIRRFFTEPVIGMWSGSLETDIEIDLIATSGSGLRAERKFFTKGVKKGVIVSTSTPYQTSLKRATEAILSNMVEAIFFLVNKYPSLGKPEFKFWGEESAKKVKGMTQ